MKNGSIVPALPLVPATIYVDPGVNTDTNTNADYGGIVGLDFSPTGEKLVFQRDSHPAGTRHMEVGILDLADCTPNCQAEFVHLANGLAPRGVAWPIVDRIYYIYILKPDPFDASTACVFAIDQANEAWPEPQSILCANDGPEFNRFVLHQRRRDLFGNARGWQRVGLGSRRQPAAKSR